MRAPSIRSRRAVFWSTVLLCIAALIAGGTIALVNFLDTSGPDGAVRGYFAALQRSDASAALGFGDVPDGPHTLLTAKVLRAQQHLAPIKDVKIVRKISAGNATTVSVRYVVAFPDDKRVIDDTVVVINRGGNWRLSHAAASTTLVLSGARQRATIVGLPIPTERVLVFPGAVPIQLDTRTLDVDTATDVVPMGDDALNPDASSDTHITIVPTDSGMQLVREAVATSLANCLRGEPIADIRCPLPLPRAVPGTMRAVVPDNIAKTVQLVVGDDPAGVFKVTGTLRFIASFDVLSFDNVASPAHQPVKMAYSAIVYAVPPLTVAWQSNQSGTTP